MEPIKTHVKNGLQINVVERGNRERETTFMLLWTRVCHPFPLTTAARLAYEHCPLLARPDISPLSAVRVVVASGNSGWFD